MNCISFFGVMPPKIFLNVCSIFCNFLCEINGGRPERGGDHPIHIFQMNQFTELYVQNICLTVSAIVDLLILIIHIACNLFFFLSYFSFLQA